MLPTFMCLSAGYLVASRKEVDSVELPYLNRARYVSAYCCVLHGCTWSKDVNSSKYDE
jgi:hypothetical protein